MALPNLTSDDVGQLLPQVSDIGRVKNGGQKLVFPCTIDGERYAVKFMLVDTAAQSEAEDDSTVTSDVMDAVTARANREVETMLECDTPYVVKVGPIPLTYIDYRGQKLVYFAEEFIEGQDLTEIILADGPLSIANLIRVGRNMTSAISTLWQHAKVHRDIKPDNIRRRTSTGDFVLLDMGLAFDLQGESLTASGLIPGTPGFYSPEQLEFAEKRQIDFRSDLFLLGIVLYLAASTQHPFQTERRMSPPDWARSILVHQPQPITDHRPDIPSALGTVIMRLLAKKPHLRYRSCGLLDDELASVEQKCEGG